MGSTMPLPILTAGAIALGAAILADLTGGARPKKRQKSIETCTANLQAMWVQEDGNLRVYHEVTGINCAQIVVEFDDEMPNVDIPGEIDGWPVRVRMGSLADDGESYGSAEVDAMTKVMKYLESSGRKIVSCPDGQQIRTEGHDQARIRVTGPTELSPREKAYLGFITAKYQISNVTVRVEAGNFQAKEPDLLEIALAR